MTFPEKEIYDEYIDELKAKAYYFTSLGHTTPVHYDWYRRQDERDPSRTEHAFDRPSVLFQFGRMSLEPYSASKSRVTIPLVVVCVQDKYVDARDGAANQAAYLKLLEWKYIVDRILGNYSPTCFSTSHLVNIETDHRNDNLHVERLFYTVKGTLTRPVIPPDASP